MLVIFKINNTSFYDSNNISKTINQFLNIDKKISFLILSSVEYFIFVYSSL